MTNPLEALLIAVIIMFIAALIFLPKIGLAARLKRAKRNTKRIMVEDALKHLYDCEYRNFNCSINSIAGNLSISADESAKLITRLESMGLVNIQTGKLALTNEGRSYALRVVRVHRLLERYLADETSIHELYWHAEAEHLEHTLTPEETDMLAAQLSNPLFDPHGDPIPTSSGEIPAKKGEPLTLLKSGEAAQIIHIEDEPHAVYSQLVAAGLHAGMQVRMLEIENERIRFEADGEECVLAPLFAENITVDPYPKETEIKERFKTLSSLEIGQEGIVIGISKACRGSQRRRLMDFGVVPGTKIMADLKSAGGDPTAYLIRGAKVAFREKQAEQIFILPVESED